MKIWIIPYCSFYYIIGTQLILVSNATFFINQIIIQLPLCSTYAVLCMYNVSHTHTYVHIVNNAIIILPKIFAKLKYSFSARLPVFLPNYYHYCNCVYMWLCVFVFAIRNFAVLNKIIFFTRARCYLFSMVLSVPNVVYCNLMLNSGNMGKIYLFTIVVITVDMSMQAHTCSNLLFLRCKKKISIRIWHRVTNCCSNLENVWIMQHNVLYIPRWLY